MGFLDVQIPDWLKPQSPAEQSATRDRAILTGMEIGARAATQRASQDHDLLMRKLQMGQQLDEFNQRMQLQRDEFAANKSIQDLQYTAMKQEAQDTPMFTSFLEQVGTARTPEEVMNVPLGKIASPKLAAQAEAARLARVRFLNNVQSNSAQGKIRTELTKSLERIAPRHPTLSMKGFAILNSNPGALTPEAADQLSKVVSEAEEKDRQLEFQNRMAIKDAELKAELQREEMRQKNKGNIQRQLSVEDAETYKEMLRGINPSDVEQINNLRIRFGLPTIGEKKSGAGVPTTPASTESGSFFNWLNGKAAGGATEPPGTAIPQVINESPVSVGGGVISAPLMYDPATKTFKVQTSP